VLPRFTIATGLDLGYAFPTVFPDFHCVSMIAL
jgi:hypothetical protein